ncbi:hypothetical protein Tco_0647032 [Tanacetum coccineum]
MQDDSIPDEQAHLSNDEDSGNDHLPKADSRKDWWKPLPEEERLATPKPAWIIPSSNVKGSSLALLISKMKATRYPDFGPELLVPEQIWIEDVCTYDISAKYGISHWWFNRRSSILAGMILRRVEKKSEHTCGFLVSSELKPTQDTGYEFKHDYTIIESPQAVVFPVNNNERKIMRFNKIYKFSDGMLTRILEALDYRVKEFKVKQLNPSMNTRFWTQKDVTRSKEFIAAIEKRLKTKRIYRNLECFIGGRVCDIDYKLL